ncbi:hypothetical protein M422DRAFT_23004 [Sphaerobolus stellatus SS14]|nr:hypothetical protein M422DRAFT_23004 [Sphaerobolus stellatus SS14]
MRLIIVLSLFLALALTAYGWTKEDYEIFDIVGELEATEGKGTTFYSFMGVDPSASTTEIAKAYRKKSVIMHPDKNQGGKDVHERFARLGVISTILRNTESRKRYDFFFKNGVPKWRGTGYYYSRFRPGLGTVAVFLVLLTSGLQYLVHKINYKNDLARIQLFMERARKAAWGPKMARIEGKRKVRVNIASSGKYTDDGEEVNAPGKTLEMVVDGDDVFILSDGNLLPLDESTAMPPAISRTWFVASLKDLYRKVRGDRESDNEPAEPSDGNDISTDSGAEEGDKVPLQGKAMAEKIGGKRRKTTKRQQ